MFYYIQLSVTLALEHRYILIFLAALQEDSYVLPLRWLGLPVKMSCPLMGQPSPNPPMVTCHSEGMVVKTDWTVPLAKINVKGKSWIFKSKKSFVYFPTIFSCKTVIKTVYKWLYQPKLKRIPWYLAKRRIAYSNLS